MGKLRLIQLRSVFPQESCRPKHNRTCMSQTSRLFPLPSHRPPLSPSNTAAMSNYISEKPTDASEIEAHADTKHEPVYDAVEKLEYDRAGAIGAEEGEHRMGVLEAVKAYPAASWWAFVMSCTIVRPRLQSTGSHLTKNRSWSHTVSS